MLLFFSLRILQHVRVGALRDAQANRIRYNGPTEMGKVHPDIVDAREQFSCEEPISDFLKRRKHDNRRKLSMINWEVTFWISITIILFSLLGGRAQYVLGLIILSRAFIWYFYEIPRLFHSYLNPNMLTMLFCTPVENEVIIGDLHKSICGLTGGNIIWAGCLCLIYGIMIADLFKIPVFILYLPLIFFLIWIILIECGLLSAFLPGWVYKSGLIFGFFLLFIFITVTLSWRIFYFLWHSSYFIYYRNSVIIFLIVTILCTFPATIAYLGWRYLPIVAEMRRRGVFDQQ